jgi:peptidoglycan/LPS O-acetylase OafA/YrhL
MSELAPAPGSPKFLPAIEALRGVAALTVVGYHVAPIMSGSAPRGVVDFVIYRVLSAVMNGTGAVVAFFVISGFVLARSLDANSDVLRFVSNRLFRLFPAAIAVVALFAILHAWSGFHVGYEGDFSPANILLNMLLIKSDINGPMWSMTVECAATPLILGSVWLFKRRGEAALWTLVAILFALSFWGVYVHLLGGFTDLTPLHGFVIGCLVHFRGQRIAAAIGRHATASVLLSVIVFCFCGSRHHSAIVALLEALSAATFVIVLVWQPSLALFRPLETRVARFFGAVSYSFYLLHLLGVSVAIRLLDPFRLYAGGMAISAVVILTTVVAILLTAPAAWLSRRWIEVPAIAFGKRLSRRRA